MSGWDGNGNFNRVYSWVADANAGLDISASRTDTDTNNITSNGLGNCLTRDGQGQPTANQPMNGFSHIGVQDAANITGNQANYASANQVRNNAILFAVAAGTADAVTGAFAPPVTDLVDGMEVCVRFTTANITTTPTFKADTTGTHTITKYGGGPLQANDLRANSEGRLRYNKAQTEWELLNPPTISSGGVLKEGTLALSATPLILDLSPFSQFTRFELQLNYAVLSGAGGPLKMQFSVNGGTSYVTSADYAWRNADTAAASLNNASDTSIQIGPASWTPTVTLNARINLLGFFTAGVPQIDYTMGLVPAGALALPNGFLGAGYCDAAPSPTGLRLTLGAGAATLGWWLVRGWV